MSQRRTYTHSQHSYVVSIDAGSFANIEIVVGGYHRGGGWSPPPTPPPTTPRASTATTRENHGHGYAQTPSAKRASPFVHLQSRLPPTTTRSSSSKRAYDEREQQRVADERRREEARRAEARRIAAADEARRRQEESLREEEERRRQQRRRAREIASAWRTYEARWALLSQRQPELGLLSALTFERIPWPVVVVADTDDGGTTPRRRRRRLDVLLRHEAIREFLLSSAYSPDVSAKDRIRAALRRWHPDKFARVLSQVIESDRDAVAEGMGVVVRCLNDMLEKENRS
ncbi:hypothetical protein EDB86DRAFT_1421802 [Lactarius hatsudake]|nr:hypothetical protein EDB86DRAFT_1421802 [Lactarius hatsudake]